MMAAERRTGGGIALPSEEGIVRISCFSKEAQEELLDKNYLISSLSGRKTVALLKEMLAKFPQLDVNQFGLEHEYANFSSQRSQVAIKPQEFILEKSDKRTFFEQTDMVQKYDRKSQRKIPGAKAVMGILPNWLELDLIYFATTREHLFIKRGLIRNKCFEIRTSTQDSNGSTFSIGLSNVYPNKLFISKVPVDMGLKNLFAPVMFIPENV